jgi:hypothetical protein
MLGLVKNGTVGVFARASSARSRDIYQRYATGLYLQAFLTLGDSALAEHVTREVLVDECALAPVAGQGEDDIRHRLAESVFRRCQQLAAEPAGRGCRPAQPSSGDVADCVAPGGLPERDRAGSAREGGNLIGRRRRGRQSGRRARRRRAVTAGAATGAGVPPAAERQHQCRGSRIG